MKTLRFLLFLLTAGMLFMGCQKELSEENGRALGNLPKDVLGNCQSPVINGNYVAGVALSPTTEYIALQINISQVGVYSIVSDTINGYYFSGTGVTGVTGINTVRLEARGTPTAVGTDVFNIKFDGTTCQINNIVTATPGGGGGGTAAVFTLGNTAGNCTSTPAGVYAQNFPTSTTLNYVDIGVTVTTAGTYNVTSTVVNGVKFSGSGNVTLTSTTIRLYADGGTPTAQGNTAYPLTVGTSTCSFSINYLAPIVPAVFTLNCGSATVAGTYQSGAIMNPLTNTITITALVGVSGAYSLTATANGVTFAGIGTLTSSATPQNITLVATGTAGSTVGNVNYLISGNGTACTSPVVVPFTAAPVTITGFIQANLNGSTTLTTFNVNKAVDLTPFLGTVPQCQVGGESGSGFESFEFAIVNPGSITTGVDYSINSTAATVDATYRTLAGSVFITTFASPATLPFKVRFSIYTSNRIVGTFSGNTWNNSGAGPGTTTFTNGSFDLNF
jgi:hypothetical protein